MKKTTPILSIIIVSYNTAKLTIQTLESIFTSTQNSDLLRNSTEIFVVDNNSSDESVEEISKLETKRKNLKLIKNKDNVGFARANNQAAKLTKGEYILLLNSDTIVLDNSLETLIETAQKENLNVITPQLLNKDKTIQPQGGNFPTLSSVLTHFLFLDDIPLVGKLLPSTQHTGQNIRNQKPDWIGGTAMMFDKKTWESLGGLDEKIFMYGEDMEICLRAHSQKFTIGLTKNSQIIHLGSASSSSKNAIHGEIKGYLYIWSKHYPNWQTPILKLILKIGIMLRVALFGMMNKDEKSKVYREALNLF